MKDSKDFYVQALYPFQDGVIKILSTLETPFFLTGGTALARGYLGHRFSDDLDFFVNDDERFTQYARAFEAALVAEASRGRWKLDAQGTVRSERFISLSLLAGETMLKLDLVNDIKFRVGDPIAHPTLGRLDTIDNILSNKMGALFRYAEKDIADIWAIWKRYGADWPVVMRDAQLKDAGIDPVSAAEIVASFPAQRFDAIKWSEPPDRDSFVKDLRTIAEEILGLPAQPGQ